VPILRLERGLDFLCRDHDPFWKGLKPNLKTLFEVSLVGDERKWVVPGKKALICTRSAATEKEWGSHLQDSHCSKYETIQ
jgi:hypothetical protein